MTVSSATAAFSLLPIRASVFDFADSEHRNEQILGNCKVFSDYSDNNSNSNSNNGDPSCLAILSESSGSLPSPSLAGVYNQTTAEVSPGGRKIYTGVHKLSDCLSTGEIKTSLDLLRKIKERKEDSCLDGLLSSTEFLARDKCRIDGPSVLENVLRVVDNYEAILEDNVSLICALEDLLSKEWVEKSKNGLVAQYHLGLIMACLPEMINSSNYAREKIINMKEEIEAHKRRFNKASFSTDSLSSSVTQCRLSIKRRKEWFAKFSFALTNLFGSKTLNHGKSSSRSLFRGATSSSSSIEEDPVFWVAASNFPKLFEKTN